MLIMRQNQGWWDVWHTVVIRNEYEFKLENQKGNHTKRIRVSLIIILRPLLGDGTLDT